MYAPLTGSAELIHLRRHDLLGEHAAKPVLGGEPMCFKFFLWLERTPVLLRRVSEKPNKRPQAL